MGYDIERRTRFARRLKAARQRAQLSAKQASERLTSMGVACSRGTLLAWERGGGRTSREPFASDVALLAAAYGCDVNSLFDDTPVPQEPSAPRHASAPESRIAPPTNHHTDRP